jgi:very-short-patch-repair endonuclease
MTPAEDALWQRLRASQLAGLHFRRQQIVDGFIADFFCRRAGLIIEVDGGIHARVQAHDAERDRILGARGLKLLRFTNERVLGDIDAVLAEIVRVAKAPRPVPSSEPFTAASKKSR